MPVLMAIPGRRLELCGHSLKLRRQATAAAAAVVYAFVTRQSLTHWTAAAAHFPPAVGARHAWLQCQSTPIYNSHLPLKSTTQLYLPHFHSL